MSVPASDTNTDTVIAHLQAAGLTVGDGEAPAGSGWQGTPGESTFAPYVIVYPYTIRLDGTLAAAHDDGSFGYQLTAVGPSRKAAEHTASIARTAMLDQTLTPPAGRELMQVIYDLGQPAERDDDETPPMFYAVDRYTVDTTPGGS